MTDIIGEFQSKEAGVRASLPKLIALIQECPEAREYYIIFTAPEGQSVDRCALVYYRGDGARGIIGYEGDVFSGTVGRTYSVDNEAIKAVAEKGGTLEDFAGY